MSKNKKVIVLALAGVILVSVVVVTLAQLSKRDTDINEPQQTVETVLNTEAEEPSVEVEPTTEVEIPDLITKTEEASPPSETAPIEEVAEFAWTEEEAVDAPTQKVITDCKLYTEPRNDAEVVVDLAVDTVFDYSHIVYIDGVLTSFVKTDVDGQTGYMEISNAMPYGAEVVEVSPEEFKDETPTEHIEQMIEEAKNDTETPDNNDDVVDYLEWEKSQIPDPVPSGGGSGLFGADLPTDPVTGEVLDGMSYDDLVIDPNFTLQ